MKPLLRRTIETNWSCGIFILFCFINTGKFKSFLNQKVLLQTYFTYSNARFTFTKPKTWSKMDLIKASEPCPANGLKTNSQSVGHVWIRLKQPFSVGFVYFWVTWLTFIKSRLWLSLDQVFSHLGVSSEIQQAAGLSNFNDDCFFGKMIESALGWG